MIKINENLDYKQTDEDKSLKLAEDLYNMQSIEMDIDNLMYETPVSSFMKTYINKNFSYYVCHKEVLFPLNNNFVKHYLFILTEDLILTTNNDLYSDPETHSPIFSPDNKIYNTEIDISNGKRNLILRLVKSNVFSNLTSILIPMNSYRDLYLLNHLIEKHRMINWQIFFEKKIPINKPFYYQKHFFLQKVNKRGKQQSRVLVFSNKFIMNVCFNIDFKNGARFEIEKQKWALAIESIKSLSILKGSPNTLKMYIDKTTNQNIVDEFKMKLKNEKERKFVFYYKEDIKQFIFQCRRIYNNLKNSFLIVNES